MKLRVGTSANFYAYLIFSSFLEKNEAKCFLVVCFLREAKGLHPCPSR